MCFQMCPGCVEGPGDPLWFCCFCGLALGLFCSLKNLLEINLYFPRLRLVFPSVLSWLAAEPGLFIPHTYGEKKNDFFSCIHSFQQTPAV